MRSAIRRFAIAASVLLLAVVAIVRLALRPAAPDGETPEDPDLVVASPSPVPRGAGRPLLVFLADPEGNGLVAARGEVFGATDASSQAIEILTVLLRGPAALPAATPIPGSDAPGEPPLAPIPEGVVLRALFLDGKGNATVDLGGLAERMRGAGSEAETLALWAVVDTLAFNFPAEARRVRILLDGREVETLGHLSLDAPLTPRRDLVTGEIPVPDLALRGTPGGTTPDEEVP